MKHVALLLTVIVLFSSCLSKHILVMSEKEVRDHYAERTVKPQFGYFNDGERRLFYAIQGDSTKPLLVLVHGAPGRWYSSINLFDDSTLLSRYRILAYDRPGYGKSGLGLPINSIEAQADYLCLLVEHFNTTGQPVTVAGRSYGTAIAACYTMKHPEEVKKLILIGSCIDPAKEKYFWFGYPNVLATVQSFMPTTLNMATSEKFSHRKELRKIAGGWQHIRSQTYLLHGLNDWISDTANAWFAYHQITNAPVSVYFLPNTGHNITVANPSLIIDLLLKEEEYEPGVSRKSVSVGATLEGTKK